MNETFQMLQRPEYVHVVLNHLPIVGLAVALLALGLATLVKNSGGIVIGLLLVALMAASVWPVIESGESAYNSIRTISDPDGVTALKQHMMLADQWSALYYVTAAIAAVGAVVVWRRPKWARLMGVVVLLLGIASLLAGTAIAKEGGEVRHPEFRPSAPVTANYRATSLSSGQRSARPASTRHGDAHRIVQRSKDTI